MLMAGHAFLTLRLAHVMVGSVEHRALLGTILTF
jgi:hypothetical protein